MINIFKKFDSIINYLTVDKYDIEGESYRFLCTVIFKDNSKLSIREYYFTKSNKRKYSYHWTDNKQNLLFRWDNAEHWKELQTFPHHVHIGETNIIKESRIITVEDVLTFINEKFERE